MSGQTEEYRRFLSGNVLKCIAMVTMFMDHIGLLLFPDYRIFRIIGRLAFPIYCFLLVEGAVHTSNPKRYLGRLFLFALVSEIPFNLAIGGTIWYPAAQNVLFTLILGLLAILFLKGHKLEGKQEPIFISGIWLLLVLVLVLLAEFARTDYGAGGVILILIFYLFRSEWLKKSLLFAAAVVFLYGGIENYAILSLVPILCYNGKRSALPSGRRKDNTEPESREKYRPDARRYFFYLFYPVHLIFLYVLKEYVF